MIVKVTTTTIVVLFALMLSLYIQAAMGVGQ